MPIDDCYDNFTAGVNGCITTLKQELAQCPSSPDPHACRQQALQNAKDCIDAEWQTFKDCIEANS